MLLVKLIIIIVCFMHLTLFCFGQSNDISETSKPNKLLLVTLNVEGKTINIKNHFRIFFVNGSDTFNVGVKGNQLILPHFEKDTGYTVTLVYKKYVLSFDRITKRMIFPGQDVTWKFGVDDRPFNEALSIYGPERYKSIDKAVKRLQYLQFDMMEEGDGIEFIREIK